MKHGLFQDQTAMTFSLADEDHTLANSVRFTLNQDPRLTFCGYSIPHPADARVNIRVQTTDLPMDQTTTNMASTHCLSSYSNHLSDLPMDQTTTNMASVEETVKEPNVHVDDDIRLEEYVCSDCSFNSDTQDVDMTKDSSSNCGSDSHTEDVEMDVPLPSVCISDSAIMGRESIDDQGRKADLDSLYQKYTDRMRWFDLLNYDRTCGIRFFTICHPRRSYHQPTDYADALKPSAIALPLHGYG